MAFTNYTHYGAYTMCVYIWYTYLAEVCVKTPVQQSSSTAPSDDQQACCRGRTACLDIGLAGLSWEAEEEQSDEKWQKWQEDQGQKVTDERKISSREQTEVIVSRPAHFLSIKASFAFVPHAQHDGSFRWMNGASFQFLMSAH